MRSHRRARTGTRAKDLAAEVQDYLDGVHEAERRRADAHVRLEEARGHLERYHSLRRQCLEDESAFGRPASELGNARSIEERAPLFDAADALDARREQREEALSRVSQTLDAALPHDPTYPDARAALADLYLERMLDAESAGRPDEVLYLRLWRLRR